MTYGNVKKAYKLAFGTPLYVRPNLGRKARPVDKCETGKLFKIALYKKQPVTEEQVKASEKKVEEAYNKVKASI
jgi:hypothetical protein